MNWYKKAQYQDVEKLFDQLAGMQRGVPEQAMLRVQEVMGGGVLNPVVEHTGDLVHRMTESNTFHHGGYEYVKEKVDKVLRYLLNSYGFNREFEENIRNNAKYYNVDENELRQNIYAALENYAQAHEALPTYNEMQRHANQAAIAVGRRQWNSVVNHLEALKKVLDQGWEVWVEKAHELV